MNIIKRILKSHDTPLSMPRSVQDLIPITKVWDDGLFYHGHDAYSMMYQFSDVNYATAATEQQEDILVEYGDMLNEIDPAATAKVSIVCRHINRDSFQEHHFYNAENDGLNVYREEQNAYLTSIITNASCVVQDKYITVTIKRRSANEARSFFSRVALRLAGHISSKILGSKMTTLNANARMKVLFGILRPNQELFFDMDLTRQRARGHSFKDYICPDVYERVDASCFKLGDMYYRCLYLKDYGSYIKDDIVSQLLDINKRLVLSIDMIPVPTDIAVKEAGKKLMGVEKNIADHSRHQIYNKNFSGNIPYEFECQKQDIIDFLDAVTKRDQHMFLGILTICHMAPTREELDADTESLKTIAQQGQCQLATLHWQQLEGFHTAVPFGVRQIDAVRTLTTDAISVLNPFRVLDVIDDGGIVYGYNTISKNIVSVNKKLLKNGNAFVLGTSGSAKSATVKLEILRTCLQDPNCNIIIIDPESEYGDIVRALGGEIVQISATSRNHINAMSISADYGDEKDPIVLKTEFVLSICEQIMGGLSAEQKSIINRAVEDTLYSYVKGGFKSTPPTLVDFYNTLGTYQNTEAAHIQVSIELYVTGSFDMFAKQTNIDTDNRLVCYDISELGANMQELGLLVVMDSIWGTLTKNRKNKNDTYVYLDEFYLLLKKPQTEEYFYYLWKRIRKYHGFVTGITQNTGDVLESSMGCAMIHNSEFLILLSQGQSECKQLADELDLSEADLQSIRDVPVCHGLIKVGPYFLPFDSTIPKETETFKLIDTSN